MSKKIKDLSIYGGTSLGWLEDAEEVEKEDLLLKDLCARLSYKTYVKTVKGIGYVYAINTSQLVELSVANDSEYWSEVFNIDEIKPYLRSLSSMTEEERKEFNNLCVIIYDEIKGKTTLYTIEAIDWLNACHFDFRNLIKLGLALEAPEGMYNITK